MQHGSNRPEQPTLLRAACPEELQCAAKRRLSAAGRANVGSSTTSGTLALVASRARAVHIDISIVSRLTVQSG
eukprot:2613812-Lingulodinium_polyedra.AAC.1